MPFKWFSGLENKFKSVVFILVIISILFLTLNLFYKIDVEQYKLILLTIRLPRVLAIVSVASILSLSGYVCQMFFKNNLAEPGVLGISSGGTLGAVLALAFLSGLQSTFLYFLTPISAIVVSFLGMTLILKISSRSKQSTTLILLGVAFNSFNGALITLISYLSTNNELRSLLFWGMGSFGSVNLEVSIFLMILAAIQWLIYFVSQKKINALNLDDENLFYIGYSIKHIKRLVLISVTVCVGVAVAFCGIVSFVGLIAPHIARFLVGHSTKKILLVAPLVGVTLLLITDFISRNVIYPTDIPASIFTSFIGVPFFIYLIVTAKNSYGRT